MYNPGSIHAPIGRAASPIPGGGITRSRSPGLNLVGNRSPVPGSPPSLYGGYPNPARPLSRGPSPAPPHAGSYGGHGVTSPQVSGGFQVEKRARSPNPYGRSSGMPQPGVGYGEETLFKDHVSALIAAKDHQFAVSGRIPVDPAQFVLFFRSKTGVAHSLDFPIDISYNTPPALDVLVAACRPHPTPDYSNFGGQQALFYPPNLPLTASLEIANFPILDAIRDSLFPNLPPGHHLTAVLDRLDVVETGSRLAAHAPAHLRNDERAGTIIVSLPVRYRGGAIVVRDPERREVRFQGGGGGKSGDLDWIALRSECAYEIEPVQKGAFLAITYAVFVKSFGPASSNPSDTLVTPTDQFFGFLSPILNFSRGKTIAFYLSQDYIANPAEVVANAIVPQLKGGDALLYDAFKFHKLAPDLHWTAGGYIWPVDLTLEFFVDDGQAAAAAAASGGGGGSSKMRSASPNPGFGRLPAQSRGGYGANPIGAGPDSGLYGGGGSVDTLGPRVRASGAHSFVDANITLLTDQNNPSPVIGKERVEFVSNGELSKLVVNVLLVVFIP